MSATLTHRDILTQVEEPISGWSYDQAFKRNRGLITEEEQQVLRNSRVAIAGMGGVGGIHLATLARLGVGKFTIADHDAFDVANFNRQQGGKISNLGRNKAEAMAEEALDINPELDIRVFPEKVDAGNIDDFLEGVDLFADGLDFFCIEARRLVYRHLRERGIWGIMAGPIGFSTAWLVFDPKGMSLDRYFDLREELDRNQMLAAFAVGLSPSSTHLPYIDLSHVSLEEEAGPSASLACQLAAGVLAADALRILLRRRPPPAAPVYRQFDAYRGKFALRRLSFGNRGLIQRIKRWAVRKRFAG